MRRLAPIAVALLAVFAGCTAVGGLAGSADDPTPQTPRNVTDCSPDVLLSDDGNEQVTPMALPEPPTSMDAASVGEFVAAYERAFSHNHELRDGVRNVSVEVGDPTVSDVETGYVVRMEVSVFTDSANRTVERDVHYDAHYFVSEDLLRRAETERGGSPPDLDLADSGLTLACWD